MAFNAGTVVSYMVLNTDKFKKGIAEAKQDVQTFTKTSGGMESKLKSVGGVFTSVGKKATLGLTVPLVGLGTAAVSTAASFQAEMSKVQAISGASADDLAKLEKVARDMGATTKFSAQESAEALTYMAMAGWDTNQMIVGLPGVMDLAAASGEDLAMVSDIVTDSLTAFGMTARQSGEFADLLASASSNANTNVAMMGEAFKYAAPIAGALGHSAEDTALAIGLMANAGIKGSMAGTSLRMIMTELTGDVKIAADGMEEITLSTENADGSMRDFSDILVDARGHFAGMTEAQKAQAAEAMVGKNAMSGFLAIMNATEEDFAKLTNATTNYTGSAKEMAEMMEDNLQGEITKLKSALGELAISIGTIIIPMVRDFVAWIQKWVDKFNGLDESTKTIIVVIGGLIAVVGPILLLFGQMATSISAVIGVTKTLTGAIGLLQVAKLKEKAETLVLLGLYAKDAVVKGASAVATGAMTAATTAYNVVAGAAAVVTKGLAAALAFITSPIGLVIAAVAALVAGVVYLWRTNEGFRDAVIKIWDTISTAVINGGKAFLELAKSIPGYFKALPGQLFNIGKNIIQGLLNGITAVAGRVRDTVTNLANSISNGFKGILGIRSPSKVFEQYGKYIDEGLAKGIKDNEGTVLDQTRALADGIRKTMENNIESINKLGEALALNKLSWSGAEITDEMKENLVGTYTEMKNEIVGKLEEQKNEALIELSLLLAESTDLTEDEKDEILRITEEKYDKQITETEEGHARLLEIIEEGKEDGLGITEERRKEMLEIQEGMKKDAIDLLSDTNTESEKLIKDLKDNASRLTAEMVSDVIKSSKEQKEETIKNAEEQYERVMAEVERLRKDGSEEAKQTADALEREAERQKRRVTEEAEEMHANVIREAKAQSKNHIEEIDYESGEIMTRWSKLKRWFTDNPITRFFKTKEEPVPDAVSGAQPRRRATGDPNFTGGWTTVGEYGKELLQLPQGAKIHNNQTTQLIERNIMGGNNRPILLTADNKIYLDGREIAEVVSTHQYDMNQDKGRGRGIY